VRRVCHPIFKGVKTPEDLAEVIVAAVASDMGGEAIPPPKLHPTHDSCWHVFRDAPKDVGGWIAMDPVGELSAERNILWVGFKKDPKRYVVLILERDGTVAVKYTHSLEDTCYKNVVVS